MVVEVENLISRLPQEEGLKVQEEKRAMMGAVTKMENQAPGEVVEMEEVPLLQVKVAQVMAMVVEMEEDHKGKMDT